MQEISVGRTRGLPSIVSEMLRSQRRSNNRVRSSRRETNYSHADLHLAAAHSRSGFSTGRTAGHFSGMRCRSAIGLLRGSVLMSVEAWHSVVPDTRRLASSMRYLSKWVTNEDTNKTVWQRTIKRERYSRLHEDKITTTSILSVIDKMSTNAEINFGTKYLQKFKGSCWEKEILRVLFTMLNRWKLQKQKTTVLKH